MPDNTTTPPDWVLLEAAKRCGCAALPADYIRYHTYENSPPFRALCDMIAKHEQPPVDRKLLCAREAITQSHDTTFGANIQQWQWIAVRAIELWEEGFGK
jgi:hypothetical protein